jgi:hypothetical protein
MLLNGFTSAKIGHDELASPLAYLCNSSWLRLRRDYERH